MCSSSYFLTKLTAICWQCGPDARYIFYDPGFGKYTPPALFASTGVRALDHAVEAQYHGTATLMPARWNGLVAIKELFELLPQYLKVPEDEDVITRLYLAAFASLGFIGQNLKGGLGLSHTLPASGNQRLGWTG